MKGFTMKLLQMERNELVDSLIANEQTKWEESDRHLLMNTDMDILEKMVPVENWCSAAQDEDTQTINALEHTDNPPHKEEPLIPPVLNLGGQDEVTTNSESEDEDDNSPLVMPVMNFGKPEKKKQNKQETIGDDEPLVAPVPDWS
jgi:hypothetical protein